MSPIPGKLKTLIVISLLITVLVLILQLIKKRVFLTVDLKLSDVSFRLNENIPNFLSVENKLAHLSKIRVNNYKTASYGINRIESEDPTSVLSFTHANSTGIELKKNTYLILTALNNYNAARISLKNYSDSLLIMPTDDSLFFATSFEGRDTTILHSEPIFITPLDSSLDISFESEGKLCMREMSVFKVSQLHCLNYENDKKSSSIIAGKIHIAELNEDINLSRNRKIEFNELDEFSVTNLTLCDSAINLTFEGYTSNLIIGDYNENYIPSLLQYIYKNNYLIIFFNSFMAILNFILFMMTESKRKD